MLLTQCLRTGLWQDSERWVTQILTNRVRLGIHRWELELQPHSLGTLDGLPQDAEVRLLSGHNGSLLPHVFLASACWRDDNKCTHHVYRPTSVQSQRWLPGRRCLSARASSCQTLREKLAGVAPLGRRCLTLGLTLTGTPSMPQQGQKMTI